MPLPYAALLLVPCLLFAGQALYNIFLHPLRRFPGPTHTAAFKWPWFWHKARGTQVAWITELHRQYGHVVRVAPDQLSYTNAEAWKDIYGHKTPAGRGNLPKDLRFYPQPAVGTTGIVMANDADHSRVRRSIAHAFSEKALIEQEPMIRHYVGLLVEKLRDAASVPVGDNSIDMVRMFNYTTFDVMADLAFGESLGLLERADYIPWVASIIQTVKAAGIIGTIQSAFPLLMPVLMKTVLRGMQESRHKHSRFAQEHVDKRLARETTRPDIWTFVLRNTANDAAKGGLSLAEMHANAATLMGAGTETTATVLSGACWLLCNNRDKLNQLNDEVRQAFGSAGDLGMQTLARLPYLNACLQESLRMFPPAPLGLPRVTPRGGAVICGKPVAERTTVYVSHFAAYHNASNFYDAYNFHPERWLPDADPCFADDKKNVMEPFSFGPRNCVGKNLAWHEMRAILANIVLNFDMQLSEKTVKNWMDQKAYLVWDKTPLYINLKPVAQDVKA
ncbi:Cytochrome P450 monooxygenase rdc4 [Lasiodiplodia theobromae]|uniref:Cytochrome P450 monooxygenase rdc4 n=1 Tax=Lasiodiplodia theobromae TaxID=45133 RepID=A0A5N5D1M9_9PEZI|nr:Cytochrome P450 monooxygenase rdc4 [Lasiodiplodia theobromae]